MKVWELIEFLSKQPAGQDVMLRLAGDNDIPVVDVIHGEIDDDGGLCAWVVLVGDDPTKQEWPAPQTPRELKLEEILRSAHAIALRQGADTAWDRFADSIAAEGVGSVTARVYRILPSDQPER